jgi:hypothetical protein
MAKPKSTTMPKPKRKTQTEKPAPGAMMHNGGLGEQPPPSKKAKLSKSSSDSECDEADKADKADKDDEAAEGDEAVVAGKADEADDSAVSVGAVVDVVAAKPSVEDRLRMMSDRLEALESENKVPPSLLSPPSRFFFFPVSLHPRIVIPRIFGTLTKP